nr:complement resistance protein TraT [Klebsiella pneumoniae]
MGTAIKKRNLEVKTQMSETIWLEPSNNKTVYLQIKNTSDKDMSGLQAKIASASLQRDIRSSVTRIRRATGSRLMCSRPIKWTFVNLRVG